MQSALKWWVVGQGAKIEAHVGTLVVFGNNELIQQAIKAGSIVQGKQKDASHRLMQQLLAHRALQALFCANLLSALAVVVFNSLRMFKHCHLELSFCTLLHICTVIALVVLCVHYLCD